MLMEDSKKKALLFTDEEGEMFKQILALALKEGRLDIAKNVVEISYAIDQAPEVEEREGGWIRKEVKNV
jgi:hypothetical protein